MNMLTYAGLLVDELSNLKITDIDIERLQFLIRLIDNKKMNLMMEDSQYDLANVKAAVRGNLKIRA